MSHSTTGFTPAPDPAPVPGLSSPAALARLAEVFTQAQLDAAIDGAARNSRATVALFAAAPIESMARDGAGRDRGAVAVEFVVEFFVPPTSLDLFHRELEAQLLLVSPPYATGRNSGQFQPCGLHGISAGIFHQYRIACRQTALAQREARWSPDRLLVDGILHQSRTGWRELD